ncbi:MAG: cysteine--tRNA ligase [Patescibacteria group bacterium]|nr:cysteine--tRNA ligase [Patescibacteria group bacterium]
MNISLYNTLTRTKEEFKTIDNKKVGLYTCGPTVYNFAHLGNLRTYIFEDVLKRTLIYNGFEVKHVMNITDVGHLTDDADNGEDKMEKGAQREGKNAWEIADYYTQAFKSDLKHLNIIEPDVWCKATENIKEQIELIKILETKGYTYNTSDGVYFDTSKFEHYNKLSHLPLEDLREGARVEVNNEKRNITDFALWKFSPQDTVRQMEWDSPWGKGFPGWHIECSAMSMKYLGDNLDIHCGGIDHINIHHTNEIAQSEAATGKPFFNYWLHGAFLNIAGGKKMAKSEGNFLTVEKALLERGIDPLVYRFSALSVHYRKPMEYSDDIIDNAALGYAKLKSQLAALSFSEGEISEEWQTKFRQAINDDLNIAEGLAVLFDLLKSDLSDNDKLATVFDFDKVLGLKLKDSLEIDVNNLPPEIKTVFELRLQARKNKNWLESDSLRDQLLALGYLVEDSKEATKIRKK